MREIFLCVLSLSLSGALMGSVLLLIHPFTKRIFSKKWNYYIWLLLAARLLIPVYVALPFQMPAETEKTARQSSEQAAELTGKIPGEIPGKTSGEIPEEIHMQTVGDKEKAAQENFSTPAGSPGIRWEPERLTAAAALVWLLGAAAALISRLAGYRHFVKSVRKDAHPLADEKIHRLCQDMAARLGIKRMPEICQSPAVSGPVTFGLLRPVILFPEGADCGSGRSPYKAPDLSLVFHHELVHIKRKDLWYKWLYQVILCVHWFNPVIYLARRQLDIDCELSCDEAVLSELTGEGKNAYGNMLITTAEGGAGFAGSMAATLLERKKDLKERLGGILQYKKQSAMRILASVCVFSGFLFLAACGVRPGREGVMTISLAAGSGREDAEAATGEENKDNVLESFGKALLGIFIDEDRFMSQTFAVDRKGEAWRAYDEDALIAGEDVQDKCSAYVYSQNRGKISSQGFLFDGTDTVLIAYASRDTEITLDSSYEMLEGRFKLVHVTPQSEVIVIDDTGQEGQRKVSLIKGRNMIKMVGQGAKISDLNVAVLGLGSKDLDKVYYSEAEEYLQLLFDGIRKGEKVIEKEKVMDVLYAAEDKEVSRIFQAMLKEGETFSPDELQELLIYSDAGLSTGYLADAVESGDIEPLDKEQISAIIPYMEGEGRIRLLSALPREDAFDWLEEWAPYLEDDEWELLLMDYLDKNELTYSQFSKIYPYLDEKIIQKLDGR